MDEKLEQRLLKLAKSRRKSGNLTIEDISRRLDVGIRTLEKTIRKLKKDGYEIKLAQGKIEYLHQAPPGKLTTHNWRLREGGWVRFGVLGDTQLGNRCARVDVLNTAYDHFAAEGLDTVYHTGNLVDGYAVKINAFELVPEAGGSLETQTAFAHNVYPKKEGITTYFITGECHEGWWAKNIGINVGRVMQDRFALPLSCEDPVFNKKGEYTGKRCEKYIKSGFCTKHGRKDLIYIGHEEADIEIKTPQLKRGVRGPIVRIIHPGGGTAYALSYKTQKLAEHLQGGEKPRIQLVGHYHKYDCNYHREIYNLQTGCLEDQTIFMRKNMLAAHVGYLILECYIGRDGVIERFRHEWKPFYDRGFYRNQRKW
jgi:biotin operon repressor